MAPPLPNTYKAFVLPRPDTPFEVRDVDLHRPGPGQVLVKVLACGVCFSDVVVAGGGMGNVFPRVPDHEIVGDVVGQRVGGAWHGGHDGHCRECRRGQFHMCAQKAIKGVNRDGGFAEYVLLRPEAVVRVPADMDPAQVTPLLCAGITIFNGMHKLRVEHGALVAVQGLGGLGHLAVQYASKMGYEVAVLSSGDDKAAFARELGAHHYINTKASDSIAELNKLGSASIVQTAPNPDFIGALVQGLVPAGKLLSLAAVGPVKFDTAVLVRKAASVHGWPSGHALDGEEAIRFPLNHGVKCMVKYPFAKFQEAVDSLKAGKPRFRNVLVE